MDKDSININELAKLARIDMSEEEKESIQKDIVSILGYVQQIQDIAVGEQKGEELGAVYNVMREDDASLEPGVYSDEILSQAPQTEEGKDGVYIKVKKIL